jgi:alpha-glucosidase
LPQPDDWGSHSVEAQELDPDSMLALYRSMLALRRDLAEAFAWHPLDNDEVLAFQRGDVVCLVNFGPEAVRLPPYQEVLLSSDELTDDLLTTDTAVWIRLADN